MDEQAFKTLEFDQLRALVRRGAQTLMGRAAVDALEPLDDRDLLQHSLLTVAEGVELRKRGVRWSFEDLIDPADSLSRLQISGVALDAPGLLTLARWCEMAMSARASILAERDFSPTLFQLVASLPSELNSIAARVTNKILPNGELDDRASPELARIRHDIARLRSNITRSLENLMRQSPAAIQDELVTIRNDRFVIPVRADHRGQVNGVAHGFSSSGATVFIEPLKTIEANNELQSLREAEEREIAKILFALSEDLRRELPSIGMAVEAIAQLDFVGARAAFSEKFNCVVPEIVAQTSGGPSSTVRKETQAEVCTTLEIIDARHPLLEENLRSSGSEVVPVSFSLNAEQDSMVISGANAGGKTVVLKTAGLLSLMALSGLPVPASEMRLPFYASILADIGDHQSIAANLSTFTSHVANIGRMIDICRAPALVLLDEVGTGTDPEEGSALGVAVVNQFRRRCRANVIATTHYRGLKMYAANEAGVINASVEFDEKTLRPTYRLLVGLAGSSSGLEIARRFGIPEEVITAANAQVEDSSRNATEYLRRIKQEAGEAETLRLALEEERAAVAEKYALLDREAEQRERERQTAFQRALEKTVSEFEKRSREMVATIQDRSQRLKVERESQRRVAELKREAQRATAAGSKREAIAVASTSDRGVRVMRVGQVVSTSLGDIQPDGMDLEPSYVPGATREIVVGDKVKLRSFGSIGIVDQIKGDQFEVRVKGLRFREKLENLELVEAVTPAKTDGGRLAKLRSQRATEVNLRGEDSATRVELNVIGQTTDEAVDAVDKFLDEAFMNNQGQLRIIHGHGTGALRRAIAELLKGHPHVERFGPAPQDEGGSGATVVQLRQ